MSNPNAEKLVIDGVTAVATALGLPVVAVPLLVDLIETIAGSSDYEQAIARAKQNALADAEDLTAEKLADAAIKAGVK